MAVTETQQELVLLDAGIFIGALLKGDARHEEARPNPVILPWRQPLRYVY